MKEDTQKSYEARLARVLTYIATHLDEDLTLRELAAVACFSPFHFHRIFRGMVGESTAEYLRRLRMERAGRALKNSNRQVLDIAQEAGYDSHEAFSRAFKQRYGLSPSQYRLCPYIVFPLSRTNAIKKGACPMKIRIETIAPKTVAYLRHRGPYDTCGETWAKLMPLLGERGYLGQADILGLCHDDPESTPPEEVCYDACVEVKDGFEPFENLDLQTIAGGTFAVTTHQGPYNTIGTTYAALFGRWLPQSGLELRDHPPFEIYLNDPEGTEPEELLTDIYMPLKGREA